MRVPPPNGAAIEWWREFWRENDQCLYGNQDASLGDARPVRPAFTTARSRVPVLVELGEDWIIERTGASYRRFIQDFDYQQSIRSVSAALLHDEIGFHQKAKVDTSSLLHGSIYGNAIEYPEDSTPWLGHVIRSAADIRPLIARMERTDPVQAGLAPWFIASYRRLGQPYRWRILHDPTSVHGPGTILGFLCGITEMMLLMNDEPGLMRELLALIADVTVAYSRAMRRMTGAPATGVGIFDDVGGLVSPRYFERFFLPVYEKVYGELAPAADDDRFLHNDARVGHLLDMFRDLGVNGINPDPETSPAQIRAKLPEAVIWGCVPPLVLRDGTPEEITAAARRTIELAGEGGGLVLTTAGSINAGTSYRNLAALASAAESFGRYERGSLVRSATVSEEP